LAAATVVGVTLDMASDYTHHVDNLKPEFLSKFPLGKIPAFEAQDGFRLFETSAITRYVASLAPEAHLLGNSAQEEAQIDQWISLCDTELAASITFVYQISTGRLKPYSKSIYDLKVAEAVRALETFEKHLASHTFLVGERITLADISVSTRLQAGYMGFIDEALRKKTPNVLRFYETVSNQPKLKAIFGETTYCDKMVTYQPPKKE